MDRNLDSLIPDMYKALEEGNIKIDAERLAQIIKQKIERRGEGPALRMSSLGERCERKLWYRQNMPDVSEPLRGETLLNFLKGDLWEEIILSIAEGTPGHKVEHRQKEVEIEGVPGHIDGIVDGCLVDVKSATERGMEKFKTHNLEKDDPFGYIDQLQSYLEATQDDVAIKGEAAFIAVDKSSGKLVLDKYRKKVIDWKQKISRLRSILSEKFPPKRYYNPIPEGKSGNMRIPMECSYCQYKNECYKDSNGGKGLRKFFYAKGPVWFTHVEREPRDNVQEDT